MRRNRRGGHGGAEFGGSGEDSFVAVVVTKLTGALLFILLLTMVIMALLPKAVDAPSSPGESVGAEEGPPLEIATPETLPEAIAGRPYNLALAASGARGPLSWAVDGELPKGLEVDAETGLIHGTPTAGTPGPVGLVLRVSDGQDRAARQARLVVFESDKPLTVPSRYMPTAVAVPLRSWLDRGFGFLLLALVHLVAMNAVGTLQRRADAPAASGRFRAYRALVRLGTLAAVAGLAAWIAVGRA